MKFKDFKFVYIDTNYLKKLHDVDSEVLFAINSNYECKPHLGLLINNGGMSYVIPLTSAKEKHKKWRDITSTNYRVYEIIDIRKDKIDNYDIIVDENDYNRLRNLGIDEVDYKFYKKRIISVLEIKKMIPIAKNKYKIIDLDTPSTDSDVEHRRLLMQKEYLFCRKYKKAIEDKAKAIYNKQITTGKVLKFHCDYLKLEKVANSYKE